MVAADRGPGLIQQQKLPWQDQARWFAKNVGLARFGAAVVSETISRMTPIAERRVGRDWVKGSDPVVQDLMDEYTGWAMSQQQLLRLHAWHYQVTGESYLTELPYGGKARFIDVLCDHVTRNRDGTADVLLKPGGSLNDGGMIRIPQGNLWRVWWPDEDWPMMATSPLRAVLDDLQRYLALSGTVSRTATSALLAAGLLWTPEEAHVALPEEQQEATGMFSQLERDYYGTAGLALTDDIMRDGRPHTMYAPAMVRWPNDLKPPMHIDLKRPQDPMNIEALEWCVKAYARGTNLPNQLVIDGAGQGNHWSAWLVDEKFHLTTTAPYADKIFHADITEYYLKPTLRVLKAMGEWAGDPEKWRMGYDPTPVLIHPDRSAQAIQLYQVGLLKAESVLRENGMGNTDLPDDAELEKIITTLQRLSQKQQNPGRPNEGAQTTPDRVPNTPSTVKQDAPQPTDARFAVRGGLNGHSSEHSVLHVS
jgi:hypothetical protein